jgi:hypothetical protein
MPRLTNKKIQARAVVTVVKKAKRKAAKPSDAKVTAAFNRATSP